MVFNRKIIFFAIFFVSLLAISTVNATDNITDDIIGSEQNPDVFAVDNVDEERRYDECRHAGYHPIVFK